MNQEKLSGVEVVIEDLASHPKCAHGPTLLFSRVIDSKGTKRRFFACSACRDRRGCPFFLWADEKNVVNKNKDVLKMERQKLMPKIDHQKCFLQLNKIRNIFVKNRCYCHTCNVLLTMDELKRHADHNVVKGITDNSLRRSSELLLPLNNNKKEAQYLFSKSSVEFIVSMLINLSYKHIICVGAPRIHEHIQNLIAESSNNNCSSILLDIDRRHHIFNGPLEFCWYNSFNNHFFTDEGRNVFNDFLQMNGGEGLCLITDPPFGGRLEPLAETLKSVSNKYKKLNSTNNILPVFLVMPYFMEALIRNTMPDLNMCDYKVTYDNHSQFKEGSQARKQGSTVRLFTNVNLRSEACLKVLQFFRKIQLPESEGYKFCKFCNRWVSLENQHCNFCNSCTSKDGRTYVHCSECKRCVKPTWSHCEKCKRCCLLNHKCGEAIPKQNCFHCHEFGHKKSECPKLLQITLKRKTENREIINNTNKKLKNAQQVIKAKVNKKKIQRSKSRQHMKNKLN